MTKEPISKEYVHEEIKKAEKRLEIVVRNNVTALKEPLSKQLHAHIAARFKASKHERDANHEALMTLIKELSDKLAPIAKVYETAGTLKKWALASAVTVTIIVTALANAKEAMKAVIEIFKRTAQ